MAASSRIVTNSPFELYSLFLDDDHLDMLVTETNRYAEQCAVKSIVDMKSSYVLENWQDVTRDDLLTFIGLVLWMGLDKKPKLRNYWSKNSIYYSSLSKPMSRNRFEAILSCIHISNNETAQLTDHLAKLRLLVTELNSKFQNAMNPFEEICIDESMIPFRGGFSSICAKQDIGMV